MAALTPVTYRKPPLTPLKKILKQEMKNPDSRLCHLNGFITDVAQYVLSPMLDYPLRGYSVPKVFPLNHVTNNEGVHRQVRLHLPSSTIPFPRVLFLIDRKGRTILMNHPIGSLSVRSEHPLETRVITIPEYTTTFYSAVLDHRGTLYAIDSKEEALAVISLEEGFQKHIVKLTSKTETLKSLAIDQFDNLYIYIRTIQNEVFVKKYSIEGKEIETLPLSTNITIDHLTFDPIYNRLYIYSIDCVSFYCCTEKLLKEFILPCTNNYFSFLKVDVEGNVYIRRLSGELSIYDPNGNLLSNLHTTPFATPFALTNKGLCVHDAITSLIIYDDEFHGFIEPRNFD